ncbi:putative Outer membrane protein (Porin) [uncultured Alphaproteobacteria bacterium]|uniref:Putative Outer membrane protein (Porin) n=1 Tax=uncultured Alphaproteobacteria bacterium TaxID=91750 RepID=A0A212KBH9_9PROT|nr:putative Outer membrane protein (Porin) [uncultured Alphaproteobacteria bacterium]
MLKQEGTHMKSILIGSTALLAAATIAPSAQASEPVKLQLGGYMEYWMAAADQDKDSNLNVNSFDIQGESEIWFVGKTTLDNGMTIGVQVELEAGSNNNGDDTIDESYLFLEGKYGKAIVGAEDTAAYLMSVSAPSASDLGGAWVTSEGDQIQYMPTNGVIGLDVIPNTLSDENKLTYFTPKFYGVQAGVSYVPSNNPGGDDTWAGVSGTVVVPAANSESVAKARNFDEAWAFGLAYDADVAGVGVKASAHYVTIDMGGTNAGRVSQGFTDGTIREFGGGLNLSYQGFTVGGGVKRKIAAGSTQLSPTDGFAWNAGVMYAEGPYKVSLNYASSKTQGVDRSGGPLDGHDEIDVIRLGGAYALGPGVNLFGEVGYTNAQDETSDKSKGNEGAYGGVVGLHLNF